VIAILGHIVAAAMKPREANSEPDERERLIVVHAGHLSSYILGVGVLLSLGMYLIGFGGNALFYGVFGSLMLAQLGEYLLRIYFYRRGI
jgi:pilus assembly protein TadC